MALELTRFPRYDYAPVAADPALLDSETPVFSSNGRWLCVDAGTDAYAEWLDQMDAEMDKLQALARAGVEGRPDRDDLVRELLAFQAADGSFALYDDDDDVELVDESDECSYAFAPSYLCCQLLVRAYLDGARVAGLDDGLRRGLAFCCLRNLQGEASWCGAHEEQLDNLRAFVDAGLPRLMAERPELCEAFAQMVGQVCDAYQEVLDDAGTIPFDQYEGTTFKTMEVMEAFGRTPRVRLFVYGSLCAGMENGALLDGCPYLGRALAEGYCLYDCEPFPMAEDCMEYHGELASYRDRRGPRGPLEQVMGELYECTLDDLRRINEVLGVTDPDEGGSGRYVLDHADVTVFFAEPYGYADQAHVFLYAAWGLRDRDRVVPLQLQPLSRYRALRQSHVWYVCAGRDGEPRSMAAALASCDDPTLPVFDFETDLPCTLAGCDGLGEKCACGQGGACGQGDACGAGAEGEQGGACGADAGEWDVACEQGAAGPTHVPARAYLVTRAQAAQLAAVRGLAINADELPTPDGASQCSETEGDYVCYLDQTCGIPMVAFATAEQVEQTEALLERERQVCGGDPEEQAMRATLELMMARAAQQHEADSTSAFFQPGRFWQPGDPVSDYDEDGWEIDLLDYCGDEDDD